MTRFATPVRGTPCAQTGRPQVSPLRRATLDGRLVFDLTTTALWSGPPAGIVRVESEFARWALAHVDPLAFGFFDPKTRAFRDLDRNVAHILIAQKAAID